MVHKNIAVETAKSPEYFPCSLPLGTFVDEKSTNLTLSDKTLVLAGSLNLWYTTTEKNEVWPLAVANANTADGKYYDYSRFTKPWLPFLSYYRNLFDLMFDIGTVGFFGKSTEVTEKLRLWTVPTMHYGDVFIFNTITNPHTAVDIIDEDHKKRNEGKVRESDEVRIMFFCKKGDKERCNPTWSADLHAWYNSC